MIPITESTLPDLMNLNRLMYSKYSRLTRSNVKIKSEPAALAPPRSRFRKVWVERGLQWQASHLGQSGGSVQRQKRWFSLLWKKDKRRRGKIMTRQRGGIKPGKNDEQFAFVLARKTRVEAECTWKWRRPDNQTTCSQRWGRGGASHSGAVRCEL